MDQSPSFARIKHVVIDEPEQALRVRAIRMRIQATMSVIGRLCR